MFCRKCGNQIPDGAMTCGRCGAEVMNSVTPPNRLESPVQLTAPYFHQGATVPLQTAKPKQKKLFAKSYKAIVVVASAFIAVSVLTAVAAWQYKQKKEDDIKYYTKLAERYMEDFEYEEAIAAYRDLIALDPSIADSYINIAEMYKAQNKYYDARAILNDGLDAVSSRDADEIEDAIEEVQDVLDTPITLSGIVTEAQFGTSYGNPTGGVEVTIVSTDELRDEQYTETEITDADGSYSFEGLAPGNYEITFQGEDSIGTTQQFEVYAGTREAYNSVVQVIPSLYAGSGTVSGRIVSATNGDEGVADLSIDIREGYNNTTGEVVSTCETDRDGYYMSDGLSAGTYTLCYHSPVDEEDEEDEDYVCGFINVCVFGNENNDNQNGTISTALTAGQMRVVLTWGESPRDLDSHLFCELEDGEREHIYYGDKSFSYNGNGTEIEIADLDWDDTTSYGPETVTIYNPEPGTFTYGVYNYSHDGECDLAESGARVEVYLASSSAPSYIFFVPDSPGYYWEILTYDTETGRISITNRITDNYDRDFA